MGIIFILMTHIFFEIFGVDTRIVSRWRTVDGAVKCWQRSFGSFSTIGED